MNQRPVILITGASSGIGEAAARVFAQEGYQVVLAARRLGRLEALAQEIQSGGGAALPIECDVQKVMEMENVVSSTLAEFGRIDVLFNNAGLGRLGWLEDLDPVKDIQSQLQVNLLGVIHMTRYVIPHMIERRSGHIVNMCSIAGLVASPTYSIYAASKFAIRGFSESVRREVSVYGVEVSVIYPGGVKTEFSDHAGAIRKTGVTTPGFLRLSPEDVAHTVLNVVRRPRRSVIIPWPMLLAVWFNSLFPGIADRVIEQRFVKPERGIP